MKKLLSVTAVVLLIVALAIFLTIGAGADFGGFSGDADYGGGGDDYGGSWDYDDDYSSGGGSSLPLPASVTIIVIVGIVYIIIRFKGVKGAPVSRAMNSGATATPRASLNDITSYKNIDPSFSEEALKEWISNAYVRLQNAWQAKDLSSVQTLISDAYYAQMNAQLEAYRRDHKTNRVEKIAVLGVSLIGWRQEMENDVIIAEVRTRITDYTVDDRTGKVIAGDASREKFMEYEWSLSRSTGLTSNVTKEGTKATNCPNCGAPIDLNKSAICPYCDSVIKTASHDWVINTIKGLSQQTI